MSVEQVTPPDSTILDNDHRPVERTSSWSACISTRVVVNNMSKHSLAVDPYTDGFMYLIISAFGGREDVYLTAQ